ncbi:acid ceramidase-like [Ciona intestinalis]
MQFITLLAAFAALFVFGNAQVLPPYTEDCQHGMYANHARCAGMPPTIEVNLDQDPSVRWNGVVQHKKKELVAMIGQIKLLVGAISPKIITAVDQYLPELIQKLPEPYGAEIQGIAKASGLPDGEILLFNIFYEIFTVCTSIVAQDNAGKLYHARNLDFGLFMGWDVKNHTWLITEYLRPLVVNVNFTRGGKTAYKSVNFAGYIGLLTGIKPNAFTITLNERFNIDGGFVGMLEWIMGQRDGHWTSFLTRTVMDKATSYDEAMSMLTKEVILAPVYYIVGGVKSGEGAVVTRDRTKLDNVMAMNTTAGEWYVLETNYDNWTNPPFFDDRRADAKKCMDHSGKKGIGFSSIFDVLSTKPVLNQLTTYTALMQVNAGKLETYIRECPHPCYPW